MLSPPLGAWLGVRLTGAVAVVVAAAAAGALAGPRLGALAVPALLAALVSGRVTFLLGAALGIAAVWAASGDRRVLAALLGVLTALASPVAALFAGLAGAALLWTRVPAGAVLAAAVAVPTAALAVAFPVGGTFPFALSAFLPAFAAGVAVALAAPRGSALRAGGALYALLCLAALVAPTPVGGNATRLGTLVAVPVAVHLLWPHRRRVLYALAVPLAYWVLQPAARDVIRTHGDPATEAAYFAPLVDRLGGRPIRVEVPMLANHGEAEHLAPHVPLARGWERQADRDRNALFYDGTLDERTYARWLRENAVAVVALPTAAKLDPAGRAEARLVARRPEDLRETAGVPGWRIFAVRRARPLATTVTAEGFTVRGTGTRVVRIRHSRWLGVTRGTGCIGPAPGTPWTRVRFPRAGTVTVRAGLRPGRPCGAK